MMQRLTTDNPTSNLSSLLNIAYVGDDERVKLRYADGQEDVDLCELMSKMIAADSTCLCKPTAEHILDGCCLDCDCEYGYLYAAATQAAELRARLMMIEDILGAEYDLDHLRTVDAVEVVHGQWIGTQYDGYADGYPVYDLWECSNCREEYESEGNPPPFNYCPHCGAMMDLEVSSGKT